uniref:Uncharacterized protein n=1 Tax=Anguilla anguilla TaxID=7936 RepID=A0A0E9U5Y7_ANGAN
MVLFYFYPINEAGRLQIQEELRKATAAEDALCVRDMPL